MKIPFKVVVFILGLLSLASCSSDLNEKLTPVPLAFGKVNELVIVADKNIWDSPVGDTLRYYLSSAYIILPQPEPVLDLRFYEPKDLKAVPNRRNFRNYLFLGDLEDADSPTTEMIKADLGSEKVYRAENEASYNLSVGRNKWAKDQVLIYQFGQGQSTLIDNLKKNAAAILNRINKHDNEIVEANIYQGGINAELASTTKARLGVNFKVPYDYYLVLDDTTDQTIWMRKETDFLSSHIILHKYPYTDEKQLTKKGIKGKLNRLGLLVSTEIEGTYKQLNDVDLPMYVSNVQLDGKFAVEARGIWEIVNDYMGGPYISYSILNPKTNEILLVEGFVHAPGKEKRDYMQQLEHIFSTIRF